MMRSTYTRWTQSEGEETLVADILGSAFTVAADARGGKVLIEIESGANSHVSRLISPDEARMIGVRLIEAAVHADGDRAVRRMS